MNAILKTVIALMLLTISPAAFADTGHYCEFRMDYSGDFVAIGAVIEKFEARCKKGDALVIRLVGQSDDQSVVGTRVELLAPTAAKFCDLTQPISFTGQASAVCTYRGGRRTIRPLS